MHSTNKAGNVLYFSLMLIILLSACNKDKEYKPDPVFTNVYEWRLSSGPGANGQLNGLALSASQHVWVCGDSGILYQSTDNGISWSQKLVVQGFNFHDIALSGTKSWICGSDGLLLFSDDDWTTHDTIHLGLNQNLYDIHFTDELNAWIVGSPDAGGVSTILQSKNGGETWKFHETGAGEILNSVYADGNKIWAVGMNGTYIYSSDYGQNWLVDTLADGINLKKILFPDSLNGFIVGENGLMLKTTDGGLNWNTVNPFTLTDLNDIFFINDFEAWVCGDQGKIFHSKDGGAGWKVENTNSNGLLNRVMFSGVRQGITIGATSTNKNLTLVYQLYND